MVLTEIQDDSVVGSILGLVLGDAFGASYEGGLLERGLWRLIGRQQGKRRWTDDSQMTLDVIDSLMRCSGINQPDLAQTLASSYRWSRGYGPGAAKILRRIAAGQDWLSASRSVFKHGSFGNGGAIRAPAIGLFFAQQPPEQLVLAARLSAQITHAHPLGQEGAVLIALATALALKSTPAVTMMSMLLEVAESAAFRVRLERAAEWLTTNTSVSIRQVRSELGNGIAALDSCVTSIYFAMHFQQHELPDLLTAAIQLGGDVDSIAAMAGAIWGAARGVEALPTDLLSQLEQYPRWLITADNFAQVICSSGGQQLS